MKELKYSDVVLLPKYSSLISRSFVDTSVEFGNHRFKVPVIPANMKAVISIEKCRWLSKNGYFYIMHRFEKSIIDLAKEMQDLPVISLSAGVKQEDCDNIKSALDLGLRIDYITIDIAHGHSLLMKDMISYIKHQSPQIFVIAGNVATREAVNDLTDWGADAIKLGIGQGYVCTTKDKTGFTRPMFSCTLECTESARVPIIADGGIRGNGDIAKALVAGATMTMAGSLFSQCTDSPAVTTVVDGRLYKQYFGSASEHNKGTKNHIEGVMKEMPTNNMKYSEKFTEIQQDLQSAISYAGGNDLKSLENVSWNQI